MTLLKESGLYSRFFANIVSTTNYVYRPFILVGPEFSKNRFFLNRLFCVVLGLFL